MNKNSQMVKVKAEPGTSLPRLSSFRSPRDLALSGLRVGRPSLLDNKAKKVYVPNLNVQRNKPAEAVDEKPERGALDAKTRGWRGWGEDQTKGRGKRLNNLVQLTPGVFSEGIAPSLKGNRFGSTTREREATTTVSKVNQIKKVIECKGDDDESALQELLRDDFIDDPMLEPDYSNVPLKLPLSNCRAFAVKKKAFDQKIKVKQELSDEGMLHDQNDQMLGPGDLKDWKEETKLHQLHSVPELFSTAEPQLSLWQLPSCLPGLASQEDNQPATPSTSMPTSERDVASDANKEASLPSRCVLKTLPAGRVGKVEILKSGRTRLILGETKLWLVFGTHIPFQQDLMCVSLDEANKSGHMTCLGQVPTRVVVSPDWEAMLGKTN